MPVLRLLSSDGRQVLREFRIVGAETTIGRERDNTVMLADDSVSRHHARLWLTADAYAIFDENSANGVWVREARVRGSAPLSMGDYFHVGDCLLQLVDDNAFFAAVPPPSRPSAPRATSWGYCAGVLLLLVVGFGCSGGLMLYLFRGYWVPLVSGGGSSTTDGTSTATPAVEPTPTPCPPAAARLCPWTYKTATTTASECPPGFCWDGGPLGSASCKQQAVVEHSHRNQWSEVFCDDGFTPVLSRCSNAVERCVARP